MKRLFRVVCAVFAAAALSMGVTAAAVNDVVDMSNSTHGYVTVNYSSSARLKVGIQYNGGKTVFYDCPSGKDASFSLDKGNGKYTFTMPRSAVTVEAAFVEIATEPETPVFTDVPTSAYYYDAVLWAVENGITVGTNAEGTTFSPDEICSRAQIVTFLWRSENRPAASTSGSFVDVASDTYYTGAVEWAAENAITVGTNPEGTMFSPDEDCTRAQIVTFLYRYMA